MEAETSVALSPEEFVSRVARESWDLFKDHAVTLVGAWLLTVLLSGLSLGLLSGTLTVGYLLVVQRLRRGGEARIGDALHFGHFVGGLVATLLIGLGVGLGLLLLVIPGLLLAVMWCFTFHGMAYQDLGAVSAMKASWALAKGAFLHVLALVVALALINSVAGAIVLASLVSVPLSLIAMTVGYEILAGRVPQTVLPPEASPSNESSASSFGQPR